MTYGLSRLVSIWMSLYYNLPSLRLWHNQTGKNPTINECLHYLGEEQQTRGRNAALYKKVSTMFNRLTEFGCKNTSSLLESSWRSALATKSIPFSEPISAVSLIDFPRYLGASWPHNDIALYFPQLKKTAVMKISDSRFRPLREKLMVVTQGLDPFIGTAFSVRYTKLHSLFNRVRCSRALPIEVGSFRRLTTFSEQLNMLHGSYIPTSELGSILEGSASLNLGNYIIARYSNAYALWQFATSDAVLKSSKRDNDYNYTLKVDVNGIEASAWIFRNALFDSEVEPNNYVGKKVRLSGFVLIGHSAIQDYRESIHVLSIAPADDLQDQKATQENYNTYSVPLTVSIKTIEEELLDLNKRIYHTKKEVISEEDTVEQQVMSEEVPKALKPRARIVGETELPADQWRVLVIMNSNRNRGFDVHEITKRLQYESGSHYSLESVRSILQQLCDKNLALMNVFGDRWYIDPTVKVITADVKLSEAAVEPIVLDYLKKIYPQRITGHQLMRRLFQDDSRITLHEITRSLNSLRSAKKVLNHKYKYYWNPYPPRHSSPGLMRGKSPKPFIQREYLGADAEYHEWQNQMTIRLTKKDIEKIPTVFFFRQGDTINVFQKSGQVKKHMIYDSESATAMLKNLTADTKKGRYSGFEFIDYVGGILRVRHTEGRIEATYTNSSSNYLKMIAQKLE